VQDNKETIIIATSLPFGTITSYFHHLAKAFVKEGYRVVVVIDNNPSTLPKDEVNLFFRKWPNHRPTKWKDFAFFVQMLREFKPLMCLSNFGSTNIVSVASYFKGVPHRWNFVHTLGGQIRIDSGKKASFKSNLLDIRKRIVYRLNTHLIANSQGTRNDVIKRFNVKGSKVFVHTFLIPETQLSLQTLKERSNTLSIVGRLAKSKGHFELLSQFKVLLAKYPEITLNIVGNGDEREHLEKEVARLEIKNNVIFSGNKSNDQIGSVYANSLAHISASHEEAFGMVTIEALREGTPVICTKTSGSLDILEPGINGEFFEHSNQNSLLEGFDKVIAHWKIYFQGAIQTFENTYSLKSMPYHIKILINKLNNN
jgi:glycosyltransferase involved in cell wall biosynthesis